MKKYCIAFLLLVSSAVSAFAVADPFSQWQLFTGGYAYLNNTYDKKINFDGGGQVTATVLMPNGNRAFAAAGKGLFIFDGKQMKEQKMPVDCFAATADIISLAVDSKNLLWIGTTQGLVTYDGTTFTNIPGDKTSMQAITDIVVTASDKVYICGYVTGEKTLVGGGVSFYNGGSWINYNKSNSDIPDNLVSDLLLDANGHLWAIPGDKHDMGVTKFDGKSWKLINSSTGLPSNTINAITTNASGKVWLGAPKGIIEYDGTTFSIKPFSNGFSPKLSSFLRSDGSLMVTALAVAENGTIYVGTNGNGLVSFQNGGLKILGPQNSPVFTNEVIDISIDKDGYKWIVAGSRNYNYAANAFNDKKNRNRTEYTYNTSGIVAYREHTKVTDPKWLVYDSTTSPLEFSSIFSIVEDGKRGGIWLPTQTDGLVMLKNGTFTSYKHAKALHGAFYKAYLAPDDKVYLSASIGGVKVFENGQVNDYAKNPNMGGVTGMTLDKNNVFWVSGQGGISKFQNGEWETFKKGDGLPSIIIYCIMKDSKGQLWAGTAKGLVKYDTTWQRVGEDVDFPNNDFVAMTEGKDGKLWLGNNKGLTIYDGTNFTNITDIPSLKIKRFRVTCLFVDKNNVAWLGTADDGVLRYDGTTWTQYGVTATGAMHDEITAITMTDDGRLFIASQVSTFSQSTLGSMPMGTSMSADDQQKQNITTRIKQADPKQVLTIIKM